MSCFKIYFENGVKKMMPVGSAAEYRALRDHPRNISALYAARNGDKEAKKRLLQINYSCYPGKDGALRGARQCSGSVAMDIDFDPKDPHYREKIRSARDAVLARAEEIGLLMMEYSVGKGLHIAFRRQSNLSQEDNLRRVSDKIGCDFDHGAKDITRVFFSTSSADLLYLSDELFADNSADNSTDVPEGDSNGVSPSDSTGVPTGDSDEGESAIIAENHTFDFGDSADEPLHDVMLRVLPAPCFSEKVSGHTVAEIEERFFELFNGGRAPEEGNRNVMTFDLAKSLRCLLDYRLDLLKRYVPRFSGFAADEWERTLENACNEPRKGMSYRMQRVLQSLEQDGQHGGQSVVTARRLTPQEGDLPPEMPIRLPAPLETLSANVPLIYRAAVCEGVFPSLALHMSCVKFRYWDQVLHEPTFMNVLVAPMSTGKGCLKIPIQYILRQIMENDDASRMREARWKQQNRGAQAKATPRPADILIQVLVDNLTDAVFNQRVYDAYQNGCRYIYVSCEELDTLRLVCSRRTPEEVSIIIRKAFDNALHGQERVGVDSVTGIAPLRFNFNASTTFPACRRFFRNSVTNGTITRIYFSTIVASDDPSDLPVYKPYTDEYRKAVDEIVGRLRGLQGSFHCPEAEKLTLQLLSEAADMAAACDCRSYRILSFRAAVIAWLKGMVLWLLNGQRWDETIADYMRWCMQYDLWLKMKLFGDTLEDELTNEQGSTLRIGRQNLLNKLDTTFTLSDVRALRKPDGGTVSNAAHLVRTWVNRNFVTRLGEDRYKKN